jgi:hypothetical protein
MKPAWQAFWVSAAVTVTVLGGGYAGCAAWTPAADAGTMVVNTVFLPTGNRPAAAVEDTAVAVTWRASEGAGDRSALTYVVTRKGAGTTTEACVVTTTNCRDVGVPAGSWTYTVRPDLGPWQGRESPPGAPVTVTAGPAAAAPNGPANAGPTPGPFGDAAARARTDPRPTTAPGEPSAVEAMGDRP